MVRNVDTKLDVVSLVVPAHGIVDLQVVLRVEDIRLRSPTRETPINDDLLLRCCAANRIVILLVEELQLIEQRWL